MADSAQQAAGGASARRDLLLAIQRDAQQRWDAGKVFEVDAPEGAEGAPGEKYFANFPYPYMNGLLHLGHAFSLSKVEFATAFHRLLGEKVLFPQGFHCTGMPIKACADKIKREIEMYGNPPVFPSDEEREAEAAAKEAAKAKAAAAAEPKADPTKFKATKGKAAAKKGVGATQWEIMRMSGIPDEEIAAFADSLHWLNYFPPLAKRDLTAMGCGIDWRRSFITTDVNPYYDAFVRWQFNKLKAQAKVVKATRYAVYSPIDGQPCADHDRASGEGVQPQEYVLIKMQVLELPDALKTACAGKEGKVFFAAATLRPETMYGQTNCWILPDGDYGAYEMASGEVFVMGEHAARNASYQLMSAEWGVPKRLASFKGAAMLGVPLKAALAVNQRIYCLPMMTILMDKGTGVVTSVPADAPDDYMALQDLKNKPALREKYGIKDEWVMPFEVIPIIRIPDFDEDGETTTSAVHMCTKLGIKSQNDKVKLAEAKKATYLRGFNDGVLMVGEHAGTKVAEAKAVIKKELVDAGWAALYAEPESPVMSRSGDLCVVALTDQWYLTYGETNWRAQAEACLKDMETYHPECRSQFEHTLGWLSQWACSRSFGLGTWLPWDDQYLIESLSDSTIYMAYYTVAHLIQNGEMYGKDKSQVDAADLTDDVWDYAFQDGPVPARVASGESSLSMETLAAMRREFRFFYPFDLRVSGKDLIQNHLTFALYNHVALFPKKHWPLGYRCNGHLMLDGEKMSKSTGNFKTLQQAIDLYSADAMRFALADAGDTMDDANFEDATANNAILRLTKELAWAEDTIAAAPTMRDGELTFADKIFENDVNKAVAETRTRYESMMFREAMQSGFYAMQNARDLWRAACGPSGLHRSLALRFIEAQALMLAPVTPHFAEHVWARLLKREGFAVNAGWPKGGKVDPSLAVAREYVTDLLASLRKQLAKKAGKGGKKGADGIDTLHLYVAPRFEGWRAVCLRILRSAYDPSAPGGSRFPADAEVLAQVKASPEISQMAEAKQVLKLVMPFLKFKKAQVETLGADALSDTLAFDEAGALEASSEYLRRSLGLASAKVLSVENKAAVDKAGPLHAAAIAAATPGAPAALLMSAAEAAPPTVFGDSGCAGARAVAALSALCDAEVTFSGEAPPASVAAAMAAYSTPCAARVRGAAVAGAASMLRAIALAAAPARVGAPGSAENQLLDLCVRNVAPALASGDAARAGTSLDALEGALEGRTVDAEGACIGQVYAAALLRDADVGARAACAAHKGAAWAR